MGGLLFENIDDKLQSAAAVKVDHELILSLESVQNTLPCAKEVLKDVTDLYCPVVRNSYRPPKKRTDYSHGTPRRHPPANQLSLIPLKLGPTLKKKI